MKLNAKKLLGILICIIHMHILHVHSATINLHKSIYSIDLIIPSCSNDNEEIHYIKIGSDWDEINNPMKRIFCVSPGDYKDQGVIQIISSGTKEKKRWIILDNGNDKHPGEMMGNVEMMVNVRFEFKDAEYWVVDRISCVDYSTTEDYVCQTLTSSSNIILNRMYYENFYGGVFFKGTSNPPYPTDNVIQNSRFQGMSMEGIDGDRVAVTFTGPNWNLDRTILNTRVVNNEILNANDGIQLVQHPPEGNYIDYSGTIIDGNHIYINSDVFTDGNGNHQVDGQRAWTENALDFKGGAMDKLNPVIVTNNIMWGFRHTDTNGGGSGCWGDASSGHYHVRNIIMKHNVIFNSERGIDFGDPGGLPYSVENAVISHNIFYDMGIETAIAPGFISYFYSSKNVTVEKNIFYAKDKTARWISFNNDEIEFTVKSNIIIDSYQQAGTKGSTTVVEDNYYYNTVRTIAGDGIVYDNVKDANHTDLTFTTDIFTSNPRTITLEGVLPTKDSQHAKDHPDFLDWFPDDDDDDSKIGLGEMILYISLGAVGLIVTIAVLIILIMVTFCICKKKSGETEKLIDITSTDEITSGMKSEILDS